MCMYAYSKVYTIAVSNIMFIRFQLYTLDCIFIYKCLLFTHSSPQSLTTSSLSAQSTAETANEVDSTTDSTLIDRVDEFKLGTYPEF